MYLNAPSLIISFLSAKKTSPPCSPRSLPCLTHSTDCKAAPSKHSESWSQFLQSRVTPVRSSSNVQVLRRICRWSLEAWQAHCKGGTTCKIRPDNIEPRSKHSKHSTCKHSETFWNIHHFSVIQWMMSSNFRSSSRLKFRQSCKVFWRMTCRLISDQRPILAQISRYPGDLSPMMSHGTNKDDQISSAKGYLPIVVKTILLLSWLDAGSAWITPTSCPINSIAAVDGQHGPTTSGQMPCLDRQNPECLNVKL